MVAIKKNKIADQNLRTYEAEASEALRTHFALSEPVAKGDTTVTGKLAQNLGTYEA